MDACIVQTYFALIVITVIGLHYFAQVTLDAVEFEWRKSLEI